MTWATIELFKDDQITVSFCERTVDWAQIGEALMMAESLLKMFRHDHQASLVNNLRGMAMRASMVDWRNAPHRETHTTLGPRP